MTTTSTSTSSRRWLIACAAALAFVAGAGYFAQTHRPPTPELDVELLDGGRLTSAKLHGQVVLLNFWATDCTTCVSEMPQLAETQRLLASRGLRTVAIALASNDPTYVRNFARTRNLPFDIAWDSDGRSAQAFGNVRLTPTSVLIDRHGRIVARYIGAPDFSVLRDRIRGLLDEA